MFFVSRRFRWKLFMFLVFWDTFLSRTIGRILTPARAKISRIARIAKTDLQSQKLQLLGSVFPLAACPGPENGNNWLSKPIFASFGSRKRCSDCLDCSDWPIRAPTSQRLGSQGPKKGGPIWKKLQKLTSGSQLLPFRAQTGSKNIADCSDCKKLTSRTQLLQ